MSSNFSYSSLYQVAGLSGPESALFTALNTTNFELVLDYLRIARIVCQHLHQGGGTVGQLYDSIRTKLIATVNAHHAPWPGSGPPLDRICSALQTYRNVWTTSYDLIIYWAMMSHPNPSQAFADAFWVSPDFSFDPADAVPKKNPNATRVWWPHGALHLYRLPDGTTQKRQHQPGQPLLTLLQTPHNGADLPLFVSEGTSADKLRVIRGSDYLSYAYSELARTPGHLVIFGQALDPNFEQHLIDAVNRDPRRTIDYGIWATSQQDADFERARVAKLFPRANLRFYDSATHPLSP